MNNNPLNSIVRSARKKRILKRTLSMLCVVVLLFTMHTLRRDANTLERIPMCGYSEEHVHTPDCYDGDALVCGRHEHIHTDACYQESPEIELGAADLDIQGDAIVDPVLGDPGLELSLGDVDLTLDMPDVNPGVASNAVEERPLSFTLGQEAMLSGIISALGMEIDFADIVDVGIVDDEETENDLIGIEKTGNDYRIWARKDFERMQLALILADDILVITLLDGVAAPVVDIAPEGDIAPAGDDMLAAEDAPAVEDAPEVDEVPEMDEVPAAQDVSVVDVEPAEPVAPVTREQTEVDAEAGDEQPAEEEQTEVEEEKEEEPAPTEGEQAEEATVSAGDDQAEEEGISIEQDIVGAQPAGEDEEAAEQPEEEDQVAVEQGEEEVIEVQPEEEQPAEDGEVAVGQSEEEVTGEQPEEEQPAEDGDVIVEQSEEEVIEVQPEEEQPAEEGEAAIEQGEEEITEAQPEEEQPAEEGDVIVEQAEEEVTEEQPEEEQPEEEQPEEEQPAEDGEVAVEQGEEDTEAQPEEAQPEEEDEAIVEQREEVTEEQPEEEQASEEQPEEEITEAQPEEEQPEEEQSEEEQPEEEQPEEEQPEEEQPEEEQPEEEQPEEEQPEEEQPEEEQPEEEQSEEAQPEEEQPEEEQPAEEQSEEEQPEEETAEEQSEEEQPEEEAAEAQDAEGEEEEAAEIDEETDDGEAVAQEEAEDAGDGEPEEGEGAAEQPVIAATVDLSGVTEYPLSLNALLADAAPAVEAPAEDAGEPAENAAEETEEAAADAESPEAAEWHIEYDEALLSVEAAEGDYLVTPLQSFEATEITVDNGSRYALTLVNCALPEEEEAAEAPAIAYPAQDFEGRTEYVAVAVSAPEGAFPEGTTMAVADVEDEKTLTDIEDTVSEEFVEVKRVHAVDITFTDAEGNEIEPLLPISVVMRVEEKEQQQEAVVVHVDDAGETEVVESQSEAPAGETEVKVEMPATEAPAEEAAEGEAQEGEATESEESSVGFEADAFSVYAVVITETIETKYIDAEGATWNISVGYGPEAGIPAGATLAVEEVEGDYLEQTAELLKGKETITLARFFDITILDAEGNAVQPAQPVEVKATLAEQSADAVKAVHFAEAGPEIIEASQADETVSFDAASFSVYGIVYTVDFHYGVDGETYEFTLPGGGAVGMRELAPALGLVEDTEDAVDLFARSVENVAFSDESLVKAVPVEMNMTVGALKQKYELESEYSAELTEEQIAELNDKVLQAPDWALVSLKPFDTEETLTVALATGETFTVAVTDAQLSQTVIAASGEAYEITVTYGEDAAIPEGAELKVREILPGDEAYASYLEEAMKAASGEAYADEEAEADAEESEQFEADYARFFDIEIWADAQKIEPAAPVTVDITLADAPQTGEELKVVHFDEANGPVVMQTEAVEASEDEVVTEAAKVRFETDGFSVYGVFTGVPGSTGLNDLDGREFKISRGGNYLTSNIDLNQSTHQFKKVDNSDNATIWNFEKFDGASPSQYYIFTFVNGQKKYMNLGRVDDNIAKAELSDNPQAFTVRKDGDIYKLSEAINGKDYFLNEWRDGTGFAAYAWIDAPECQLTLSFVTNEMKNVEQYMLVTKYEDEYYVVLNDGKLEKAEKIYGDPVSGDFTTPMTWTWDGSHLFHNSLAVDFVGGVDQRASDYYRRYIDPTSSTGLAQEHGKYVDTQAVADQKKVADEKNRVVYVYIDTEATAEKKVKSRKDALNETSFSITGNAQFKIFRDNKYMGVQEKEDGTLWLAGNRPASGDNDNDAATDFWFVDLNHVSDQSYIMMDLVGEPVPGEQYVVVVKYEYTENGNKITKYRIVKPDGTLTDSNVAEWQGSLTFATPDQMKLWTYSDNQIHYHDGSGEKYLNPYTTNVITDYKATEGANNQIRIDENNHNMIRGYNDWYFKIDGNRLVGAVPKTQWDGTTEVHFARLTGGSDMHYGDNGFPAEEKHMVNHIDISINGLAELDVPLTQGTYYYRNDQGELVPFTVSSDRILHLTKKVDVNEEDIKKGTVEAYVINPDGSYNYKDNLFTITGYSANDHTDFSTNQVRIEGNFKVADLPDAHWYDRDSTDVRKARLDNKVYYTVTVTKKEPFLFIDEGLGQIFDSNGEPMFVTMDMTYSASFNYWDWNGVGQDHNNECPPLQPNSSYNTPFDKSKIDTSQGNATNWEEWVNHVKGRWYYKWQGNQELGMGEYIKDWNGNLIYHWKGTGNPPEGYSRYCNSSDCARYPEDWDLIPNPYNDQGGGIAGYGNSGMDFVLGGDAGDLSSNVVALNITKKVVDQYGNIISVKTPMTNVFDIYYYKDGEENTVANGTTPTWNDATKTWQVTHGNTSGFYYENYKKLHSKKIKVGGAGMGMIYDYSVQPGMFYIEESTTEEDLPRIIRDSKDQEWEYIKTYIETEYVWRNDGDKDEEWHVTGDYTLSQDTPYRSVPEVLGEYHLPNGATADEKDDPYRNGFLRYTVYNVYEPKPINIQVKKEWAWQHDTDAVPTPDGASITVKLGRYRLEDDPTFTPRGTLTITDSYTGLDSGDENKYDARYVIDCPDGSVIVKQYKDNYTSGSIVLDKLKAGQYVVYKVVPAIDNYAALNDSEKIIVNVPRNGGNGTANFKTTRFTKITDPDSWVNVGIRVAYSFGENRSDHNLDSIYNTGYMMKVPANSDVEFTYRQFKAFNPGNNTSYDAQVPYSIYRWTQGTNGDVDHWDVVSSEAGIPFPNGAMRTVQVADQDVCIMIHFGDEHSAPAMGIRFLPADSGVTANAVGRATAPRANATTVIQKAGSVETPSPIEGMVYQIDHERDEQDQPLQTVWTKTVTLNNGNNWKDWFMEGSEKLNLPERDPNGNPYVYYIADVKESGVPEGTGIDINQEYSCVADPDTGALLFTFTVTNRMPDKTKIRIKKVSSANPNTLLSAAFELQKRNGDGSYSEVQDVVVTDGNSGEIEVGRGHYKLVETQVPEGYVKTGGDPEFDVTANSNGEIVVTYNSVTTNQNVNELTVENTPKGALKITKVVQVDGKAPTTYAQKALTNGTFTFQVTDASGTVIADNLTITYSGGDVTNPSVGYVEVGDLIPGASYTVTETGSGNLTPVQQVQTITAPNGGVAPVEVSFINNIDTGSLTVSKTVVGSTEDQASTRKFSFTVTLSAPWDTLSGTYGDMNFTGGAATFELAHDEHMTASGLPVGARYTVEEETVNGFVTTISETTTENNTASGTISTTPVVVPYTNTRREVQLSGTKTWVDGKSAGIEGADDHPDLTLELYSVTGEAPNEVETKIENAPQGNDSNSRYYLSWVKTDDTVWSYSITHLPKQDDSGNPIKYRVREVVPEGYAVNVAYSDGTVDSDGNITDANFVNTELTQITVTKTWKLNGSPITEPDEIDHITLHLNRTNGGVKLIGSDAAHTVYDSVEDSGYAPFMITRVVNEEGEQRTVTWPKLTVYNLPRYWVDASDGNKVKAYTYFFVEEEQGGWKANYSADQQEATTSASAATTTGGTIDIENTKSSVSLPATGGEGTGLYYVLGTLLTLAAVALMIAKRRRDF